MTSPGPGASIALGQGSDRPAAVAFEVSGVRLKAPGTCAPSDGPCGHVLVTIDGASCNGPGTNWNLAAWASPVHVRFGHCEEPAGEHTVTLTLVHDDRTPAMTADGTAVSSSLTLTTTMLSLYERLGGAEGIRAGWTTMFSSTVLTNGNLGAWFLNGALDREGLIERVVAKLGEASGGPEAYGCRSMAEAHAGKGVSTADMETFHQAFLAAFADHVLDPADVADAWDLLSPHSTEIVEDTASWVTLYQQAGRWAGLRATTNDLGNRIIADPTLAPLFLPPDTPDAPPLYTTRSGFCLARILCAVAGGPCIYGDEVLHPAVSTGACRDLVALHTNMVDAFGNPVGIDHFVTLAGHLSAALDTAGVPAPTRDELLAIVATTCESVVADPALCQL